MNLSNREAPIIRGFAPDPSVVRINDTYFLVTSSFHLFPGLPIYASKDLISWAHIGNAVNRSDQLSLALSTTRLRRHADGSLDGSLATGGLYAPTIRQWKGTVYITCTNVIHRSEESEIELENFIISTRDIWSGHWSDPVYFDFHGIDPDIFFEDDRVFVQGSNWDSSNVTLRSFELDIQSGKKLSAEKVIWEGFSMIIPEGPHIYKRGEWYYLLAAEGGTAEGHRITIARSKNFQGPFDAYESNPILKVAGPDEYVQYNGHGDLFQDTEGRWWIVYLGVQMSQGRGILSRETFLTSVEWPEGGWPRLHPLKQRIGLGGFDGIGRLRLTETKLISAYPHDMVYIKDRDPRSYDLSENGRTIVLVPSAADLSDCSGKSVSFIGKRQRSLDGTASVRFLISASSDNNSSPCKFGLAYYKDEYRFARVFKSAQSPEVFFEVVNRAQSVHRLFSSKLPHHMCSNEEVEARIEHTALSLTFSVRAVDGTQSIGGWVSLGTVDTSELTDPDFVGPVIGVFAIYAGVKLD